MFPCFLSLTEVQRGHVYKLNRILLFHFKTLFRHLFYSLLHLVANVISELEEHEDMLSPWKGECNSDQCLSGLAVMILAQIPIDWGSIQCIGVTDRSYITKIQDKCHLFICTTDIKSQFALKMGDQSHNLHNFAPKFDLTNRTNLTFNSNKKPS